MYARGLLIGIERGTTRAHLARATLESIAYQTRDLVVAMAAAGQHIEVLRADGGGTANRFLMQFQADLLGIPVEVAAIRETTALGAAFLAGLAVGIWKTPDQLRQRRAIAARYEPKMSPAKREQLYSDWQRAVERSRSWTAPA
jgi:glycerol kinase